jgi:RNA polymerase sigma-70 factor (ECF subfamily)
MISIYTAIVDDDDDKEKVEKIYTKYKQLMYKKAFSILKHEQDAQDIVHEVFVKIIGQLHNIYGVDDIRTQHFVMILTENASLDLKNRNNKHEMIDIEDFAEILPDVKQSGLDNIDMIIIKSALKQLPKHYSHILCLTDYLGYSIKQTAILLNLSEDNAYKRLQRARAKMAELLEKEGFCNV